MTSTSVENDNGTPAPQCDNGIPTASGVDINMDVDSTDEDGDNSSTQTTPQLKSGSTLLTTPTSANTDGDSFKTPGPVTPSTPSSSKKRKRLTPEERGLRDQERLEKRRKFEELKQQREAEKQKKEQEKLEKAQQREAEKLRKDEEKRRSEEERKRIEEEKKSEKLKKDEEKKRQEEERKLEKQKKEEERKKAEEDKKQERIKKEEERKKKEDEKKVKIEEKERERMKVEETKAKQAKLFTNFFQKPATSKALVTDNRNVYSASSTPSNDTMEEGVNLGNSSHRSASANSVSLFNPLPFQIKTDMSVAPLRRRDQLSEEEKSKVDVLVITDASDEQVTSPNESDFASDYLKSLKNGKGRKFEHVKYTKESPEIQIINGDDESVNDPGAASGYIKWRMKLLQFHENRRPPYWGTWKRQPKRITARKPLARDEEIDYEFDTDDEWEDEPEDAEEIENSDKEETEEKEEDGQDEDEEEGWMVPHGYLSDTERDGSGGDLESLKNREKDFYKSLKEKTSIGFPFISTENLSTYIMRLCPVFDGAVNIKPKRTRTRAKVSVPLNEKNDELELTSQRKSTRTPKLVDTSKVDPYAKTSGFLALQLPSEDEDDMDWDAVEPFDVASSSSDSGSDSDSGDDESSDNEDLFIPIKKSRSKI